MLEILSDQRNQLAQLASDSEEILRPLSAQSAHVAGFLANAGAAGQATGERGAELEASLQKFPHFLREFRATMRSLQGFSDAGTPVLSDLGEATPALTEATRHLAPFTSASTVALKALGNAGEAAGPTFRSADPVVVKARNLARSGASPTTKLAEFLVSTKKTHGWDYLVELIYNGTGAVNQFDQYGHFIQSVVALTNCNEYEIAAAERLQRDLRRRRQRLGLRPARRRCSGSPKKKPKRPAAPPRPPSSASSGYLKPSAPARTDPRTRRRRTARRRRLHLASAACPPQLPPRTMKDRSGIQGIASNPVLVGAVTVLVVLVAVFLAYNANNGLPFVSTYDLKAEVPDAQALVKGNEVRIGGARVGVVKKVVPVELKNGNFAAELSLSLDKSAEPIPKDSTMIIRPKSPLGLKYLQIVPGSSSKGFKAGETIPLSAAKPEPVDIDQFFDTFDEKTRLAIRQNEAGFGNALAGRGPDLNAAFGSLRKLAESAEAPLRNLVAPSTDFAGFWRALEAFNATVAPVAQVNADLFVALDATFGAFARVSRPYIQETISKGPATLDAANSRPAGAAALPARHRTLLRRLQARRQSPRRNLADARRGRAWPGSRCCANRRSSTPSCRRPPTPCSPSRKRPASSTASTC